MYTVSVTHHSSVGYHYFWKTWKSLGIQKWSGKRQGICVVRENFS